MKFITKTPVNHNGKLYPENSEIELNKEQAEELLNVNAIKPLPAAPKNKGTDTEPAEK